ncbi:hypothetical protein [Granulicella tundricola]|uniref:YMGG-like Gly-zipper domain-containing protein n=1 Tax=Granulicella tundricola (strain ATCC BAA-1859 / DSM 23138 / MP5ACTX9) TaxID=1198114 RepID=E8X4R6_GRATM|nr:hypothetical protein [Granulicella tundricola]ADW70555.1 hypothetical protein AciX9_3551 [Granulicella tundricola MP5ACTX9]
MNVSKLSSLVVLSAMVAAPLSGLAQHSAAYYRAKRSQSRHDSRHHTPAKVIGGSAAGGAVIGALAGGGKGALIGGAIGAGGGVVANKVRTDKGIKAREREGR